MKLPGFLEITFTDDEFVSRDDELAAVPALVLDRHCKMTWDGESLRFTGPSGFQFGFDTVNGKRVPLPGSQMNILKLAYRLKQGFCPKLPSHRMLGFGADYAVVEANMLRFIGRKQEATA